MPESGSLDLRAALEAAGCPWTRRRQAVYDHLRCLRSGQVRDLDTPFDPGLPGRPAD